RAGRQSHRRQGEGRRRQGGGFRSRRLPIPRQNQGLGGRGPRGRTGALTHMGSRYPHSSGERSELADRVVRVNRVAKVVKGGRKFSFSALIVVGDMNGRVGAGIGKAREVTEAIRKGMDVAKRNMITVPMVGTTIPHEVHLKWGAARIMLKPAAPGTGVISGGAMRAVIETAGIKDILTKSHGTNNPINTVRATLAALQQLRTVEQIVGRRLANAYRRADGKAELPAANGGPETTAETK